jgi:GNAT superfamily N-acetyltransferase
VSAEALFGPEPLEARHDVSSFGCGAPALDDYLAGRALTDARAGKSQTQVACRGDSVVAYYSLAAGSVEPAAATERAVTGKGRQPIPVIVLARLAVDLPEQGRGLGEQMLLQALARSAEAASLIGVRAVLVHAKDRAARGFYERYGFEPSPTHPLHLLLLMKDIRRSLGG